MKGISKYIRRSPRVDTSYEAMLINSEGTEAPVKVIDLSSGGFRIRTDETLFVGEEVRLWLERYGEFPAEIRWVLGGEAGGIFLKPVTLPTA